MDRALGSFLGLAVGDALGATVEFYTAREIAAEYKVHNQMVGGGWLRLKPGQVTDDTQMALALGSALISANGWNLRTIADSFVTWMRSGPADIGNTCQRGIRRYLQEGSLCSPPAEEDGGNGAAMRNLPTILVSLANEQVLIQRSIEQAHITHNHPKSDAATSALACMTRRLLLEGSKAPCNQIARDLIDRYPAFRYQPWPGNASGYIVDTVQTVFDGFFHTGSFEECLVRVINRGGDADTNGALAGQLAGALYGVSGIPSHWLKKLDPKIADAIRQQTMSLLALNTSAS